MAEVVQRYMEEMVPELEAMRRSKLFDKRELRIIASKRKAMEYKLRKRIRNREDILKYVAYEQAMLQLIDKRQRRNGACLLDDAITRSIRSRITRLYRFGTHNFGEDVELWLAYIDYLKESDDKTAVSRVYDDVLKIHNKKPLLWVSSAQWQLEYNCNADVTRSIMQRALRYNGDHSQLLWREYLKLEMLYVSKLRERRAVLHIATPAAAAGGGDGGGRLAAASVSSNVADIDATKTTSPISNTDDDREEMERDAIVLNGGIALVVFKRALERFPNDHTFALSLYNIIAMFEWSGNGDDNDDDNNNNEKSIKSSQADDSCSLRSRAKQHLLANNSNR